MGGNDIRKVPGELPEPEDWPPDIKECSSPPCMLRELNPAFLEHSERSAPARPPAVDAKQDWEEVRLWRKVKRAVLIERRLAMPTAERVARSEAITAALAQVLSPCRGTVTGFYWPSGASMTHDTWFGVCM